MRMSTRRSKASVIAHVLCATAVPWTHSRFWSISSASAFSVAVHGFEVPFKRHSTRFIAYSKSCKCARRKQWQRRWIITKSSLGFGVSSSSSESFGSLLLFASLNADDAETTSDDSPSSSIQRKDPRRLNDRISSSSPFMPSISTADEVYARLDSSGRGMPVASWKDFLVTTIIGITVCFTVLLPAALLWQTVQKIVASVSQQRIETNMTPIDSAIPFPKVISPHAERRYDVVVLGSTGFTGRLVMEHLVQRYCLPQMSNGVDGADDDSEGRKDEVKDSSLSWAIAGRSLAKLQEVKKQVAEQVARQLDMKSLPSESILDYLDHHVDMLVVDTSQPDTIPSLVQHTKCVITTAGPFEVYGSPVVEGCAKYGTHYVDITGEVDWANTMQVQWQDVAQQTGAKIVSLCGMDSIPWDLSTQQLELAIQEKYHKKGKDEEAPSLEHVEFWDELHASISAGSLGTIANILGGRTRGKPQQAKNRDANVRLADGTFGPSEAFDTNLDLWPTKVLSNSEKNDKRCLPLPSRYNPMRDTEDSIICRANYHKHFFLMAPVNSRVVQRSNALRRGRLSSTCLVYREGQVSPDFKTALVSVVTLGILFTALLNPLTSYLIRTYGPQGGPAREEMEQQYYLLLTGQGRRRTPHGADDDTDDTSTIFQSTMLLEQCPGYQNTARMVAESGLCLAWTPFHELESRDRGGFYTPSTAMGQALLRRLQASETVHFVVEEVSV